MKDKVILNDIQKEFIWHKLDMEQVYCNEQDNKFSTFETAKQGEWRLDFNGDKDYPYSLFVVVDYWDDITQDFASEILNI